MDTLRFAYPWWLAAGAVIVLAMVIGFRSFDRRRQRGLARLVSRAFLARDPLGVSRVRRFAKRACLIGAIALVFAALARPQLGHEWREVKRRGIDILFALDTSRSMLAEDIAPSRLERAKLGMMDFVNQLGGDRVGLLPFAGSAFLLCPLTLDYSAFQRSLEAVDTEIIPRKGTDLASAIREAQRVFDDAGNNHRILVVITDGEDFEGEALAAAEEAAGRGMVIHTVGIGSADGSLIPLRGPGGGEKFLRDSDGDLVRSQLDEGSLRALAQATGGSYAAFGNRAEGLQQIYREKLILIPKEQLTQRMQKVPLERFQWPLGAAVLLLLIEIVIGDHRRAGRRARGDGRGLAALKHGTIALLVGFGILGGEALHASPASAAATFYNEAVDAYRSADLDRAAEGFQNAIEASTDLSLQERAYYNLGNTLFQRGGATLSSGDMAATIGNWEKSLAAFEGAIRLDPSDADARHNRDFVRRKLDELKQEQEQQSQSPSQDSSEQDQQSEEPQDGKPQAAEPDANGDEDSPEEPRQAGQDEGEPQSGKSDEGEPEASDGADGERADGAQKGENERDPSDGNEKSEPAGEEAKPEADPKHSPAANAPTAEMPAKQDDGEPSAAPSPQPEQDGETAKSGDQAAVGEARREDGEMSREEAQQLLRALEGDEQQVLLVPARSGGRHEPNNTTNGKDW